MAKELIYKGKACSADSVKKRLEFQGIPICVDRPKGSVMKGKDDKGEPWSRTYKYDYGFIPKTLGGDDDGLDVFIGPDRKAEEAYWAIQNKPDGSFDEYKVFLGFDNRDAAIGAYKQHIPKKFFTGLVTMKVDMMRAMLKINPTGSNGMKKAAMFVGFHDELEKIGFGSDKKFKIPTSEETGEALGKVVEYVKGLRHKGVKGQVLKAVEDYAKEKIP